MKLNLDIMNEVFDIIVCPYLFRNELRFKSRKNSTGRYGIETAAFFWLQDMEIFPSELKESKLLNKFKSKIRTWKPEN